MIRKILVPLDGSTLAENALEPALALAQTVRGEILLLRVPLPETMLLPVPEGYGLLWPDQSLDHSRAEAREYLAKAAQNRASASVILSAQLVEGDVAGVIVDTARARSMDMIVMSTHGYSGVTRWVLGSVTEKVLRHAPCPVLAVRAPHALRRMLIPVDGSKLSEHALDVGLQAAAQLNCSVTLLRVVPGVSAEVIARLERIEIGLGRRLHEEALDEAKGYLTGLAGGAVRAGQPVAAVVRAGPPAPEILSFADSDGADVIVMATHGRTGLRRWTYGSVTEKVMRGSQRPAMLIVRPADHHMN